MTHTIITEADLMSDDMPVGQFRAAITFHWAEGSGDGWNEPREDAHAEFCGVKQVDGNWLNQKQLDAWASEWLAEVGDLDAILDKDRSTAAEQMAALRAAYARQGVALAGVG